MSFTDFILTLILLALICDIAVTVLKRVPQTDLATLDAMYYITHDYMIELVVRGRMEADDVRSMPNVSRVISILKAYNHRGYSNLK